MPMFPVRDRTIVLTLESSLLEYTSVGPTVLTTPSQPFVNKFLPSTGLGGAVMQNVFGVTDPSIELVGANSIDISHDAAVAEETGLFTSYLQPWFIKPVHITIKGESYLGAYLGVSRGDNEAKRILEAFRKSLNDFTALAGKPGTKERVQLEIRGYPKGMRKFFGYLTKFSTQEQVTNAYILSYDLSFVGRNIDNSQIVKGKGNATAALQAAGG